ncbi:MAG TPA: phenylalanine--tRNA ligase subunit beta, partial [Pirellulaceae bacterium]|nr:phenylalanine--tRNA ligase subunit beta [Pirellulaceae bacterium]
MLVSWKWLGDYVPLPVTVDEVVERLTMSGLNHESTKSVGDDQCIDLEVTSNRPDCLGHFGVAREIAALFRLPLKFPDPQPTQTNEDVGTMLRVVVESPDLCPRYTARVIRGVKIGPSPAWMQDRLATIGVTSVNNVVDATNYVMFECGHPLHAFDMRHLHGGQIVVRRPKPQETIVAIDHCSYTLAGDDCVIADGTRPVAVGGVMGGADSEISDQTRDVVIEAAVFSPLAVRNTARRLNLHSPSSFRFERRVDWHRTEWASRRCCQLILELAGGQLLNGVLDVGQPPPPRSAIVLRKRRIEHVLGIEIPDEFTRDVLPRLGIIVDAEDAESWTVSPPTWRHDVEREADLIEEVGRLYGYHHIPDDVPVPLATSGRTSRQRVLDQVRRVMAASGLDEAMTPSMVPETWSDACSPWTDHPPLGSSQPMLGVLEKASQNVGPVQCLRRSLIPNLLEACRINEYRFNDMVELFETAHIYLPRPNKLPHEALVLGLVSGKEFLFIKGIVEAVVRDLDPDCPLRFFPLTSEPLFDARCAAKIELDGEMVGMIGTVGKEGQKRFGLRRPVTVAELDLTRLENRAVLVRRYQTISEFPPVSRDFNFIVAEQVTWFELESQVVLAAGSELESVRFREIFRDPQRDGAGRKRILLSVQWRSHRGTMTGEQIEEAAQQIILNCGNQLNAQL